MLLVGFVVGFVVVIGVWGMLVGFVFNVVGVGMVFVVVLVMWIVFNVLLFYNIVVKLGCFD